MKINFLLVELGHTGGCLAIYKHADNLTELGHEVAITTPAGAIAWKKGAYGRILAGHHKKTVFEDKHFGAPLRGLRAGVRKLKACARWFRPAPDNCLLEVEGLTTALLRNSPPADVVVATYWKTALAAAYLSAKSTALFYMQHYEELLLPKGDMRRRMNCRMSYGLPVHLISNSDWLRDQIKKRYSRDSYRIEHAVTRPDLFHAAGLDLSEKFSRPQPIRIVSYCNAWPLKGWKHAAEAMRLVQEKHPEILWQTFGQSVPVPGVKVQHLGRITDEELADLYRRSHIGFMSSIFESFPLPPLEMMACGCAVVTTPLGTEAYTRDGQNCLLARPADARDLADKILSLVEDLSTARRLAKAGVDTSKDFTWKKSTSRLLEIIELAKKADNFADIERMPYE